MTKSATMTYKIAFAFPFTTQFFLFIFLINVVRAFCNVFMSFYDDAGLYYAFILYRHNAASVLLMRLGLAR